MRMKMINLVVGLSVFSGVLLIPGKHFAADRVRFAYPAKT
jgi:hypothetical protein